MGTDASTRADPRALTKQDLIGIYEELSPRLFRYAVRLLGDAHLAEDCVSETFTRLLEAIRKGGGPTDNLKAYLYRIAHNWITDYYRGREPEPELETANANLQKAPDDPATVVSRELDRQRVREALLSLSEDQRQVIMLRFFEDWSHEEAAAALEKSVEASRALQYRALKNLRSQLIPARDSGRSR